MHYYSEILKKKSELFHKLIMDYYYWINFTRRVIQSIIIVFKNVFLVILKFYYDFQHFFFIISIHFIDFYYICHALMFQKQYLKV